MPAPTRYQKHLYRLALGPVSDGASKTILTRENLPSVSAAFSLAKKVATLLG